MSTLAVAVVVELLDHCSQLLLLQHFPQLLPYPSQVSQRDLPLALQVEQPECLQGLLNRVTLSVLATHDFEVVFETDPAALLHVELLGQLDHF